MSDDDFDGAPFNEWFDSEADFPVISSVNTTPCLGVNERPHSANTSQAWAQETRIAVQWIQPPV